PTEVTATLAGARRAFGRRIVAVFQPHRYTRTRDLFRDFPTSFNDADVLLVTGLYAASDEPIAGVSGACLADASPGPSPRTVHYVEHRKDAPKALAEIIREGDLVLTLGAGDITHVGPELLGLLRA